MSETDEPQQPTTPDGVTDPLLWRLAVGVTDAHQRDETGHCGNLLCQHQEWPCEATRNAQRALTLAGVTPEAVDADAPQEQPRALPVRRTRAIAEAA